MCFQVGKTTVTSTNAWIVPEMLTVEEVKTIAAASTPAETDWRIESNNSRPNSTHSDSITTDMDHLIMENKAILNCNNHY